MKQVKITLNIITDEITDFSATAVFWQAVFHLLFQHVIVKPCRRQTAEGETVKHICDSAISQCASTLI